MMWIIGLFVAVIGACMGSFINVIIHRLPIMMYQQWHQDIIQYLQEKSLSTNCQTELIAQLSDSQSISLSYPASHCVHCHHRIAWRDNIPIISHLLLGGRCRHCQNPIAKSYLLIELMAMLLSVMSLGVFGISMQLLWVLSFVYLLLALSAIDYKHQLLPDRLVVILGLLGMIANASHTFATASDALLGAVAGFGVLWFINTIYRLITGHDGMGLGDAKLLGVLGIWLGVWLLPLVLFVAALFGVVAGLYHQKQGTHRFAFGPYLSIGGVVGLFFGKAVMAYLFMPIG
ncbi:A24 family peptidase [Moraxella sp.]|uniref:prepilin peptidase n=1 Tax=Moraxella sp. TaxID=479 RepID=UPI0026DBF5F6|nr:A24 family peptidase [Moraxella sp.]MDO4894714.1 A24 family peptidase [Moraxella sp.]